MDKLQSLLSKLREIFPYLLISLASVVLAIPDALQGSNWWILIVWLVFWSLAILMEYRTKLSRFDLETSLNTANSRSEKAQAAVSGVLSILLEDLVREIDLSCTNRVTVYYKTNNGFIAIARTASVPSYKNLSEKRKIHPENVGVLGLAWSNPDPILRLRLDKDPGDWVRNAVEKYGYQEDAAKAIRMKSRSYFARRIQDGHGKDTGVLVFESLDSSSAKTFSEGYPSLLESIEYKALSRGISSFAEHAIPSGQEPIQPSKDDKPWTYTASAARNRTRS